jgi:4-amino-4-deoxy-L-arabinose transferase-like glycosyltransferase
MTKIPSSSDSRIFWIAAAAIVVFVYFFGLTIPLVGPDEPRYAQVAREMFERGDWVTPTLGGFNWFEKPALLYWLQIIAYKLLGVSEFAARSGSAVFGLGTIAAVWVIGRMVKADGRKASCEFANWLALITASSIGLIVFSRGASFDIIVTFPITAAMACFFLFDLEQSRKDGDPDKGRGIRAYVPLFGFYFFIGVALLAKGLIGIVFPFTITAFYFLFSRRLPSRTFLLSLIWGMTVANAIAATWYVPMYLRHGWKFIDEFFVQHHFQRFTSNKYLHPQPFYFFFWVLPLMTIPWLPFFLLALWRFGKRSFYGRDAETQRKDDKTHNHHWTKATDQDPEISDLADSPPPGLFVSSTPLLRLAFAWLLVPLVFFSFSGSKLPGYIVPALPPAMIITTLYVMEFVRGGERRAAWIKALAITTLVIVVAVIIFALPRFADMDSVKSLIEAANRRGYQNEKVLTLHTISHNAEFYAAGRLVRDGEGKQKRLLGVAEVSSELGNTDSEGVLVIVPLEYLQQLVGSPLLASEVIGDNGELAIAYVRAR